MKRAITIMLAASMMVAAVSGCGNKTTTGEDGKYTYTMTMYQSSTNNPDAIQLKAIEDKYNMDLDVWNVEWQKYEEILNLKLAGGEVPDILYCKTAASAQKYVDQGVVAPIPLEKLKEKAPNMLQRLEEDAPGILKYYYIDGELYSLPSFSVGAGATGIPMVWRGDWLKNVGITKIPETMDEYEQAFYKFTKEDPDGNGKNDTYGISRSGMLAVFAGYGYVPTMGQTGTPKGYWLERDGKLVYSSIQPEMKEALARLSQWYKDGVIDPEFITGENKGGYWAISHQFVNGIIGFTTHGTLGGNNPYSIECGDIIRWGLNDDGIAEAGNVIVLYDCDRDWYNSGSTWTSRYRYENRWHCLWIYDKEEDYILSVNQYVSPVEKFHSGETAFEELHTYIDYTVPLNGQPISIWVYDKAYNELREGDLGEFITYKDAGTECTRVLGRYKSGHRLCIIYK